MDNLSESELSRRIRHLGMDCQAKEQYRIVKYHSHMCMITPVHNKINSVSNNLISKQPAISLLSVNVACCLA
jgi:hypothetical protein